jgi:HAMP domain-containing protein
VKSRFTFQTLILIALAPALTALAAFWAVHVYRSTHRIILDGFDRKLLALAGGAAAMIDGDAHADYQQRRELMALAPQPGGLAGVDMLRQELVVVNPATGGAHRAAGLPEEGIRGLATAGTPARLFGHTIDGGGLVEFDAAGRVVRRSALTDRLDGLFGAGAELLGWLRTDLYRVDPSTGRLTALPFTLPESLLSVAVDPTGQEWFGLTIDRAFIVVLDAEGRVKRRLALYTAEDPKPPETISRTAKREPPPLLHALAFSEGRLFGVGRALFTIDREDGRVARGEFTVGFFDVDDPFYRQNRAALVALQRDASLSYLYTQVYLGDKKIYYVLDGTTGAGYSRPGSGDEMPASSVAAAEVVQFVGRPWISPIQQWEAWGLLKSCFTPIRSSNGKVIAMAGADVDIGVIRGKTRWALFAAIVIGVCSLIGAGFVSLRLARVLTRPLQQLKESALWIAAGYYGARVAIGGSREVSALAGTIDELRIRLEQEQKQSHAWLGELRGQRERSSLTQALDATMRRLGGLSDPAGATGACRVAENILWWFAPAEPDEAASAAARARVTVLARELLEAHREPAELASEVLASVPTLRGVAVWHAATHTVFYHVREPVTLRSDGVLHRFVGEGHTELAAEATFYWATPANRGAGKGGRAS